MEFGIAQLPNRIMRVFTVKSLDQLPNYIRIRKGLGTLPAIAEKIGVEEGKLAELGISTNGIDLSRLKNALTQVALKCGGVMKEEDLPAHGIDPCTLAIGDFPARMGVRKGDSKTVGNVLRIIVGRLGNESAVFEPFDIVACWKREDLKDEEKYSLLTAYAKGLPVPSREELVLRMAKAKEICADNSYCQGTFVGWCAKTILYPEDPSAQENFAIRAVKELLPRDPSIQAAFVSKAAEALYPRLVPGNQDKRDDFAIRAALELYPGISDSRLARDLIEMASRDLYIFRLDSRGRLFEKAEDAFSRR